MSTIFKSTAPFVYDQLGCLESQRIVFKIRVGQFSRSLILGFKVSLLCKGILYIGSIHWWIIFFFYLSLVGLRPKKAQISEKKSPQSGKCCIPKGQSLGSLVTCKFSTNKAIPFYPVMNRVANGYLILRLPESFDLQKIRSGTQFRFSFINGSGSI